MPFVSSRRFKWDTAERLLWTTLEFGVGLGITEVTPLTTWWAAPIGLGLVLLKAAIGKKIGQRNTASWLPSTADPAGTPAPVPPPASP
ncbi:hypothetical protein AB0M39_40180 [Streptomyces sp. NPDC051907]|uniref:hypothetical protein n=1 Tax=Streptomyces sp. NPDC051907 TaxID=3155284 RepID=UPI00342C0A99